MAVRPARDRTASFHVRALFLSADGGAPFQFSLARHSGRSGRRNTVHSDGARGALAVPAGSARGNLPHRAGVPGTRPRAEPLRGVGWSGGPGLPPVGSLLPTGRGPVGGRRATQRATRPVRCRKMASPRTPCPPGRPPHAHAAWIVGRSSGLPGHARRCVRGRLSVLDFGAPPAGRRGSYRGPVLQNETPH